MRIKIQLIVSPIILAVIASGCVHQPTIDRTNRPAMVKVKHHPPAAMMVTSERTPTPAMTPKMAPKMTPTLAPAPRIASSVPVESAPSIVTQISSSNQKVSQSFDAQSADAQSSASEASLGQADDVDRSERPVASSQTASVNQVSGEAVESTLQSPRTSFGFKDYQRKEPEVVCVKIPFSSLRSIAPVSAQLVATEVEVLDR